MTSDEIRAAMADPVAQRLLGSADPARLAYVAPDGTPRAIPVGFHWDGTTMVIGTVPTSAKVADGESHRRVLAVLAYLRRTD